MHDAEIPASELRDLAFAHGLTRDPARSPMQWTGDRNAGFTTGTPWIRVASDFRERNVKEQTDDRRSLLSFYRQLIWLRHESEALQVGSWEPLIRRPRQGLVYLRTHQSELMLVALNFTGRRQRLELDAPPPQQKWITRLSTRRVDVGWPTVIDSTVDLGPYEATIFSAQRAPGVA